MTTSTDHRTTTEKGHTMSTSTITVRAVRAVGDVQTAATRRYLDREGIDFTVLPARTLTVNVLAADGTEHSWSGFRPDRLKEAVADLTRTGGDRQ